MSLPKEIGDFINENRVASVCFVASAGTPHCISCLYAYDTDKTILWIKSSVNTEHDGLVNDNTKVAGTILPEAFNVLKIRGVQFKGEIVKPGMTDVFGINKLYYFKYPIGLAMPGYIWGVKLKEIKFTDTVNGMPLKKNWKEG